MRVRSTALAAPPRDPAHPSSLPGPATPLPPRRSFRLLLSLLFRRDVHALDLVLEVPVPVLRVRFDLRPVRALVIPVEKQLRELHQRGDPEGDASEEREEEVLLRHQQPTPPAPRPRRARLLSDSPTRTLRSAPPPLWRWPPLRKEVFAQNSRRGRGTGRGRRARGG